MPPPPAAHPYPPSWLDRLQARIDRLPVAPWATYLIVWLALSATVNLVSWFEGVVPFGTFDAYINSGPLYLVAGYAAIHLLDRAAARAWWAFWPTTDVDEATARERAYQLTTMPARPVLATTGLGLVAAALFLVGQYGKPLDLEGEPLTLLVSVPFITIGFVGTVTFAYHTVRQLRIIAEMHRDVVSVDLLQPGPLNAFGGLTAATGGALLVIGYASVPTNPSFADNLANILAAVVTLVLAIATFVVPLWGIHRLLAAEQSRRLAVVHRLVDKVTADIHARAQSGDLADADKLGTMLESLLAERELLARAPTWPWTSSVLRAFTTAVVLPIVLWLVFRILERTLSA